MSTSTDRLAPYFEAYPEKIKHRRLELGLTVKALSQKSGVPYSNVSRVNSGDQANPLLFNEAAIADCLGLSLDQLCGLKTPVEDDSSLRKRIHELELSDAQKMPRSSDFLAPLIPQTQRRMDWRTLTNFTPTNSTRVIRLFSSSLF